MGSLVDRGLLYILRSYCVLKIKAPFHLAKSLAGKKTTFPRFGLFETLLIVKMAILNVNDLQIPLRAC